MADELPLSLFTLLKDDLGDEITLIRCTKATLVHLSHSLEDIVLSEALPALLFTGFQKSSHWSRETERYRALAEVAQQVCIFAGEGLPPESSAQQVHVTLSNEDPLRQEWFLAILSTRFSVVLCGQDQYAEVGEEAMREFDTLWTFDPAVITRVLDLLEGVVARYRPERLAMIQEGRRSVMPQPPDLKLVSRLSAELLRYEENLQRSLRRVSRELEEQLSWRRGLTEMLVHDLRTPLQGVMQTLDFLRQQTDLEQELRDAMLRMASLSAEGLNNLVQLILDTNRLEGRELVISMQPIVPEQLLYSAVQIMRPLIELANLKVIQQIAPDVRIIWCDTGLLGRVLQNLLGNAIKFTPAGGQLRLEVSAGAGGQVIIRVRDTGDGIPADTLPFVFERYYRSGGATNRRGMGIGLYFCRLAVEAHGGQIRADSQIALGTVISITLPGGPPRKL